MICIVILFTLSVVSLCHSLLLQVSDDELVAEVNKRVNPEINFDLVLQKYNLTSFRTLLMNAKLFDRLNVTNTSYTVFAPTNKAIMNAKSLLSNTTRLPEILMYHVHLGSFPTSNIQQNMKLKTLLGGQKKIRFERYKGVSFLTSSNPNPDHIIIIFILCTRSMSVKNTLMVVLLFHCVLILAISYISLVTIDI